MRLKRVERCLVQTRLTGVVFVPLSLAILWLCGDNVGVDINEIAPHKEPLCVTPQPGFPRQPLPRLPPGRAHAMMAARRNLMLEQYPNDLFRRDASWPGASPGPKAVVPDSERCKLDIPQEFWNTTAARRSHPALPSAQMDPRTGWLAMLRIPKTGSTSMLDIVKKQFQPRCVASLNHSTAAESFSGKFCVSSPPAPRWYYPACSVVVKQHVDLQRKNPGQRPCKLYLNGHADHDDLRSSLPTLTPAGLPERVWLVTVLRHPVQRTLSEFRECFSSRRITTWDYRLSPNVVALKRRWQVTGLLSARQRLARLAFNLWLQDEGGARRWQNRQTRYMAGHDSLNKTGTKVGGNQTALLELALENMARFTVVGLTDQMAVTRSLLTYHAGDWFRPNTTSGVDPPAKNVKEDLFVVDEALRSKLAEMNDLDLKLYTAACQRLKREVALLSSVPVV